MTNFISDLHLDLYTGIANDNDVDFSLAVLDPFIPVILLCLFNRVEICTLGLKMVDELTLALDLIKLKTNRSLCVPIT